LILIAIIVIVTVIIIIIFRTQWSISYNIMCWSIIINCEIKWCILALYLRWAFTQFRWLSL